MISRIIVLASLLILWGCSTASYEKQVGALAAGLSEARESFDDLSEQERSAFIKTQVLLGLQKNNNLVVPPPCGTTEIQGGGIGDPSSADCVLQIATKGVKEPRSIVYTPAAPQAQKLAASIERYGSGLVKLAAAKDIAELKEAVGEASAAISSLATTVGGEPAAAVGPVTSFVAWVAGQYLDSVRFEELRRAVNSAVPLMNTAADLLAKDAAAFQKSIVAQRSTVLSKATTSLARLRVSKSGDEQEITQQAEALVAGSIALETFAKTDTTEPFAAMKKAHQALADSLNNPKVDLNTVFSQLQEFLDQIEKLRSGLTNGSK